MISKPQLEQINTTLDNLIYKPDFSETLTSIKEEDTIVESSSTYKEESLRPFQLNLETYFKINKFEVCFLELDTFWHSSYLVQDKHLRVKT